MSIIRAEHVTYIYPDGTDALQDISLEIYAGDTLGIIGCSGSGKSTLLRALAGLIIPAGKIQILGRQLDHSSRKSLFRESAVVMQNPEDQLLGYDIARESTFGLNYYAPQKNKRLQLIEKYLKIFSLDDIKEKKSSELSFGEQKKLCLTIALSQERKLLFLDEPTMGLAAGERRSLIQLIKDMTNTRIIASNDLNFVLDLCKNIFLLHEGKLITAGRAHEILADKELMEKYGLEVPLNLLLYQSIYV
ncbi:MAG: ABC transporter ATP-binding protein [Candidatus Cloacimonetes bacterium]|nr:ABC transporter ATP-binding protein [Candidatus Cloacimonadota bacterium]